MTIYASVPSGTPQIPLTIELWEGTDPNKVTTDLTGIDSLTIPAPLSPPNTLWQCAVTNITAFNLSYTLTADVKTTNALGNYYQVLEGMNDTLANITATKPARAWRRRTCRACWR